MTSNATHYIHSSQDALVRDVRDRLKIVESQVRHHTDAVQELKVRPRRYNDSIAFESRQ